MTTKNLRPKIDTWFQFGGDDYKRHDDQHLEHWRNIPTKAGAILRIRRMPDSPSVRLAPIVGVLSKQRIQHVRMWTLPVEAPTPEPVDQSLDSLLNRLDDSNRSARNKKPKDPIEDLRHRVANADDYFSRKASEVLDDDLALRLLAVLYEATIVDTSEVDTSGHGIALAKLTAANFCEIGADVIYITKSGQQFVEAIENS